MTLAELSFTLLNVFESVRLKSYKDVAGIWTIGYGHTGPDVKEGQFITLQEAQVFFETDTKHLFDMVKGLPLMKAAAYVSFGYNCGAGALHRVLNGQAKLLDFTKAGKPLVEYPGLVARRKLEQAFIDLSGTL